MRALVYDGPGRKAGEDVPDPVIRQGTGAIVRFADAADTAASKVVLSRDPEADADR